MLSWVSLRQPNLPLIHLNFIVAMSTTGYDALYETLRERRLATASLRDAARTLSASPLWNPIFYLQLY
ncbi:MAG: hypothetical protein V7K48_21890 [Nostoc sp.]|uniref:hypothetical protein n=1 Tax=Nostoc sp. TaxID=1180 RepID=UPI002FF6F24B